MPRLAFDVAFCAQLGKLQGSVKQGVFDAWEKFERLTLDQLFKDQGLKLETLKQARDPHIRTIRIDQGTRGVVLAPDSGDTYVLLRVMPHDKAIAWAVKQKASINTVTQAVEIRDIAMLDELTPSYERLAPAPDQRLFARFSDGDLAALGIDDTTLRQARVLTTPEQLEVFAPYFPQDQREVLEYLAAGFAVEDVWRDLVAVSLANQPAEPVGPADYESAIHRTRTRIALVTASEELRDILEKPFDAWRVFLHPSQHKVAYRASFSGPAQVTGGPGTGKTVVALHRVRHLLRHLRDGDRILLTTYTNALVAALRAGLGALVEKEALRDRVDIMTVDAFAGRVVSTSRRPLRAGEEQARWDRAAQATGFTGTAQFLAQEYKHVILAQNLRTCEEYEAADRKGRGSALPVSARPLVWRAIEEFTRRLAADGLRTYLGTCAEAADLLQAGGPRYRHVVVDEAQDLHPAQWRVLRAAAPTRPDDLFITGDPHQRIYDTKVSLKAIGIKVAGRSTKMRKNYRSTHEILSWSTALLHGRSFEQLEDETGNETLLGYRSALHGNGPESHAAESPEAELKALVTHVRGWLDSGITPGEIGVSTRFNKTCEQVTETLRAAGIPATRVRGDAPALPDAVSIGTMHSFKGLEYRCVAVIGVHDGALPFPKAVTPPEVDRLQHEADLLAERCLLFVACTRARDGLYVSWSGKPSPFLLEAAR
ncbi:UvrD-helicase domain-containing protein [Streptomyces sp. NBC_00193]|uniref:UvrD-helicase domain-containing protein n=1 Tax=Streptomyces sp. NBC_00193 TaxID=2975675 RepID=UPI002259E97F|nr:UvrD-helicase domain-containing protein [Streptomyces sp. NBC_00193]MCX5295829.1 UvrD-helicase domain-containing protein [Streptomyces sp. NBC_00193]